MDQGLGPVVGNRFTDERTTKLKPHLMERLVALTVRAVPLGTMVTEDDGRMAFVPNYTHTTERAAPKAAPAEVAKDHAFKQGDKVRVICTSEDLMSTGMDGRFIKELLGGLVGEVVALEASGLFARFKHQAGDALPQWWLRPRWLQRAEAEGDDEREAMTGFDPMTEPLQVGDEVEVVYEFAHTGKRGKVTRITGGTVYVEDGACGTWGARDSLKLLARKATPA